jgi:CHAT domain-containing protein/tetratricopeptide (TPR) repeat protein
MSEEVNNDGHLRKYLLGELPEAAQQALEERLMTEAELFDLLQVAEDELIDDYLLGALSVSERSRFDGFFLSTPERRRKLSFAMALRRCVTAGAAVVEAPATEPATAKPSPRISAGASSVIGHVTWWNRAFSSPYLRMAAAAVIVLGLGLGIWRAFIYQSDVDKGMAALARAYPDGNPIEARISELDYPPSPRLRGSKEEGSDKVARDSAERFIFDAVRERADAKSYHALGRLYLAEQDFDEAARQFERALQTDRDNAKLHSDLGAALLERAKVSAQTDSKAQNLGRSLQELDRALELAPSLSEALFNRALCLDAMMASGQAQEAWKKYLEVDTSSQWAAEARKRLGESEQRNRRSADKEALFEDFVTAFRASDKAKAWDAYANTRYRNGNYIVERLLQKFLEASTGRDSQSASTALKMLSFAAQLDAERIGDHYLRDLARYYARSTVSQRTVVKRARELMTSAGLRYDRNEFDDARDLFAKASEFYQSSGDTSEALFARGWESFSVVRVPDTKTAHALLEQLSPILLKKNYRWLYAQTLYAIADIENSQDHLSDALSYSDESLQLSKELEDPFGTGRTMGQLTSFYLQFGDYEKSLTKGFVGLEAVRNVPADAKQVWPFYYEMALAYLSLNLSGAALAFGKEALHVAIEAQFPLIEARSYARLGLIYQARSDYDEAMRNSQLAVDVGRRLEGRSALNTTAAATLSLAHLNRLTGSHGSAIELYIEAIALYKQLGLDIYTYEAQSGRLHSLIALGDDAAAAAELPPTMKLYEDYRFKIAEESNRNRFFDRGHDLIDLAVGFEYSRKKNPQAAYNYAEASRARSLFDLITGESSVVEGDGGPDNRLASRRQPMKLEEIQSHLPDDVQVLQYAVLDDKVICWRVSKGLELEARHRDASARILDQMVREYVGSLSGTLKADTADVVSKSKALYDILISPIKSLLDPNKTICIVPDKSLNYVPFAALISPASGRYLIQDFKLQYSPSASILVLCTEMAKARQTGIPERLLCVGDPDFDHKMFPSLPKLESARTEAERIGEQYCPKKVLVGADARKEEVKREFLLADVAHFATHYVPDPTSPMLSRLLLARDGAGNDDDGYLRPAEIFQMKLNRTRLVVLSGCQTGVEKNSRGEGAISVVRPFLAAGVPVVVATLWSVETEATKDLMIAFHKYRKGSRSTVESLRQAQLDALDQSNAEDARSFTWASFVIIGGVSAF